MQQFVDRFHDAGDVYKGIYGGLYCTACEAFYARATTSGRAASARSTASSRHGSRRRTGSSGSRPTRTGCSRTTTRTPSFVHAAGRATTRRARSSSRASRTSRLARARSSGACRCRGTRDRRSTSGSTRSSTTCSALTYARPGEDLTARYWPARWQLMAKDILKFHAVIWPAMLLMSAGYELPRQLLIHGYLTVRRREDVEVARQRARPVRGHRALRARRAALLPLPRRALRPGRRRLLRPRATSATTSELANDLGNLVSRTVAMVGALPRGAACLEPPRSPASPPCSRPRPARSPSTSTGSS